MNLFLRWKAVIKGAEEPVHEAGGRAECTDITVMDDDFDTKFTIDLGDNAQGRELLAVVKSHTAPIVRKEFKALRALMSELHTDSYKAGASPGSSGASSPAQASNTSSPTDAAAAGTSAPSSSSAAASPAAAPAKSATAASNASTTTTTSSGQTLQVKTISQTVKFETDSRAIFETLLDAGRVSAFTGSAAQISAEKGSAFKLFGGSVVGITEDAVPGQRIAQKWRFASWPAGHYSQVLIEIQDKGGSKCLVKLTQTGVPESDYDRTRIGWEEHFWRRIKGVFGWSYKMKEQ